MINFRSASVDGYGDRDDIALARDKDEAIARDNMYAAMNQEIPVSEFASDSENAFKITEIVKRLIAKGGGRALYFKHQIFWDVEDLYEAAEEASFANITPDGWDSPLLDSEQIVIDGNNQGHEYEIIVSIYE